MAKSTRPKAKPSDQSLWYKDAIIYELHVRAFFDENNDGIGDFKGLAKKLEYLRELGVTAIWLLPFYPSPLRDDGYDIADYRGVHPPYGSLADVRHFIREAHKRGIKVITELVINHTSDQHPWFQKARRAKPGSPARDFYTWSKKPNKYRDARIIFTDTESSNWAYDATAKSYYWHRFYSHQPDLNYDHPPVRKAVLDVLDYWFTLGVDGMRLDAIPYLYQREGTSCENLPETHEFLKKLRRHLDNKFENRMLLAEANQWPDDAAQYFGEGDQCHMNFHFPLMPRLFMALHMEDRFPIIDILNETPEIPENCQWAIFLRNHDELTLEMVTDEERDYMYRVYASEARARINLGIRRRLAPLLGNDRRRIELMNSLLFSMPGTPVIYYGDEIGMGDNVYLGDRNGVRTPMQWSPDRNAGFSKTNPQSLYLPVITDPAFHFEAINVETQLANPRSLLWWMKRIIALRKRYRAFGRGDIRFLNPDNRKVLAFIRTYESERILIVANLSRFVQYVTLDLSDFTGVKPIELFGQSAFPTITDSEYLLTLGPHAFFWFLLPESTMASVNIEKPVPVVFLSTPDAWQNALCKSDSQLFADALCRYVVGQRWFAGKAKSVRSAEISEVIPLTNGHGCIAFVAINYADGDPDLYSVPIEHTFGDRALRIESESPKAVIARSHSESASGILFDPTAADSNFVVTILNGLAKGKRFKGRSGSVRSVRSRVFGTFYDRIGGNVDVRLGTSEQSNSSAMISNELIFKLYRRLESGQNPEVELGRFLGKKGFRYTPKLVGHLEYQSVRNETITLAVIQELVINESNAWELAVDRVQQFASRVASIRDIKTAPDLPENDILQNDTLVLPPEFESVLGSDAGIARLLGRRTAEMHLKLASDSESKEFKPEPFTPFYRRALVQSIRKLLTQVCQLLRKQASELPGSSREEANRLVALEPKIGGWLRATLDKKFVAHRIRIHGDYHLGQVLHTGRDFVIIDFEGEPARSMQQRRTKRSALVDVAGMVRSFHYAALTGWNASVEKLLFSLVQANEFEHWMESWYRWMSAIYLHSYFQIAKKQPIIVGESPKELTTLLNLYVLEKAIYEVGYELNNRPHWAGIPLAGIRQVLEDIGLLA